MSQEVVCRSECAGSSETMCTAPLSRLRRLLVPKELTFPSELAEQCVVILAMVDRWPSCL